MILVNHPSLFLFLFVGMMKVMELIVNKYEQTDVKIAVMENDEYGGTYDRPWVFSHLSFLNGSGGLVYHGR